MCAYAPVLEVSWVTLTARVPLLLRELLSFFLSRSVSYGERLVFGVTIGFVSWRLLRRFSVRFVC